MAKKGPRKKLPKELAVINADNCTGCESCLEVCPVDCITLKTLDRGLVKTQEAWCEIDLERCVGCEVCVHIACGSSMTCSHIIFCVDTIS